MAFKEQEPVDRVSEQEAGRGGATRPWLFSRCKLGNRPGWSHSPQSFLLEGHITQGLDRLPLAFRALGQA